MSTRAPIKIKPTLGMYLYKKVEKLKEQYWTQQGKRLSEAAIARMAGMVPETFRRLVAGEVAAGEPIEYITLDNALRLIQIFRDPGVADHYEYLNADSSGNAEYDKDSLVAAALAPLLNESQKTITRKLITFLAEHPDAEESDLADFIANIQPAS